MEALRIFSKMRKMNVEPHWISLVSVLRAYTDVVDLGQGNCSWLCDYIGSGTLIRFAYLVTAMYAKCWQDTVVISFFDQMKIPNVFCGMPWFLVTERMVIQRKL